MVSLPDAPVNLHPSLQDVVSYRKSGLSLNHVVGCPLNCAYCVRHLFDNFEMTRPHLIVSDQVAVKQLTEHWAFRRGKTPIQIFNKATDPFLAGVKEHLIATLEELDRMQLTNPVLVITRWRIEEKDILRLESLQNIRLTILVTWSGITDTRIEPVDSGIAEMSLELLGTHARRTKKILYWRPIVVNLNDTPEHISKAHDLSKYADATVFTGLFYRQQIRDYFLQTGLPDLYPEVARRKIFPRVVEERILHAFHDRPLFRKTSCAVGFAHGTPDYNGHYCIREVCDICPASQQKLCEEAHQIPDKEEVLMLARLAKLESEDIEIKERCIEVSNSCEEQRYFIQHFLNYQVHDKAHPHLVHRHGRAEVGWQ